MVHLFLCAEPGCHPVAVDIVNPVPGHGSHPRRPWRNAIVAQPSQQLLEFERVAHLLRRTRLERGVEGIALSIGRVMDILLCPQEDVLATIRSEPVGGLLENELSGELDRRIDAHIERARLLSFASWLVACLARIINDLVEQAINDLVEILILLLIVSSSARRPVEALSLLLRFIAARLLLNVSMGERQLLMVTATSGAANSDARHLIRNPFYLTATHPCLKACHVAFAPTLS